MKKLDLKRRKRKPTLLEARFKAQKEKADALADARFYRNLAAAILSILVCAILWFLLVHTRKEAAIFHSRAWAQLSFNPPLAQDGISVAGEAWQAINATNPPSRWAEDALDEALQSRHRLHRSSALMMYRIRQAAFTDDGARLVTAGYKTLELVWFPTRDAKGGSCIGNSLAGEQLQGSNYYGTPDNNSNHCSAVNDITNIAPTCADRLFQNTDPAVPQGSVWQVAFAEQHTCMQIQGSQRSLAGAPITPINPHGNPKLTAPTNGVLSGQNGVAALAIAKDGESM